MKTIQLYSDELANALVRTGVATVVSAPSADPAPVILAPVVPADTGAWPRILEFAQRFGRPNVRVMADAPINWQWTPPMSTILYTQGGHYVFDPSNGAKVGQPLRSAAGFPLFYAVAGDNSAVGTPSVQFGDLSFNSDAEVFDYIARTTPGPGQDAANKAAWDAVGKSIGEQNVASSATTTSAASAVADGDIAVAIEP